MSQRVPQVIGTGPIRYAVDWQGGLRWRVRQTQDLWTGWMGWVPVYTKRRGAA